MHMRTQYISFLIVFERHQHPFNFVIADFGFGLECKQNRDTRRIFLRGNEGGRERAIHFIAEQENKVKRVRNGPESVCVRERKRPADVMQRKKKCCLSAKDGKKREEEGKSHEK